MDHLDDLLAAIDEYVRAKELSTTVSSAAYYDWDCGIGNEMSDMVAAASHREKKEKAKKAVEAALNKCIDERVDEALKKRLGSEKT